MAEATSTGKVNIWLVVLGVAVTAGTVFVIVWSAAEGWKKGSK